MWTAMLILSEAEGEEESAWREGRERGEERCSRRKVELSSFLGKERLSSLPLLRGLEHSTNR